MSSEHEIAILTVGHKPSPFIEQVIQEENIPFSIVANNGSDFQIHHADPTKILNYSLEFTNIIESIAKKSMDSLAIFETLGQFFEFYNPLHLSTLNYLISKYATSIKPNNKNYLNAWKQITTAIFEDEFIYPLFEETRILHIREGEVEVPVRQFLISNELELKKNNIKNNSKSVNQILDDITGIIDIDVISRMKLCNEAVKQIESASAVIIAPTDVISLFIMFHSESFRENLQKTSGKIAFISPLWSGNELSKLELTILQKTDFEPNLLNIVDLLKESVDTIIIDTKDSELVPQLREAGVTVIVEDLNPENQQTTEFLETVLKTLGISLESILVEPKKSIEGLGEKLVNLFRARDPKEEEIPEIPEIPEEITDEESQEIIESLFTGIPHEEIQTQESKPFQEELTQFESTDALTDEFEMEIIDTEEEVSPIPDLPTKESTLEREYLFQKTVGQFALPGIEQLAQFELEELDSLDVDEHIITSIIDRAISSSNVSSTEVVFSDLLSLQNNPLLIDKIYQMIMKRLVKLREVNPEEKIADMVTYLSAHKPEYYSERLEVLLEDTINTRDDKAFFKNLKIASLIIKSSLLIAGEVIENFLSKYIPIEDIYLEDKLRRLINVFAVSDFDLFQMVSQILINIYRKELEKTKQSKKILDKIIAISSMFDGCTVGLSLILSGSDEVLDSFSQRLAKKSIYTSFKKIVLGIIKGYREGTYEQLKEKLFGRDVPEQIEYEMMKRKYESSLSKVGSIPLEIFAERVGHSIEKTEKIIYDMILKEEIQARIELVSGRLYIVQEKEEIEEEAEKELVEKEKIIQKPVSIKKSSSTKKLPAKKPPAKKLPAKKPPAKKPPAKKSSSTKKPSAKKPPAKKSSSTKKLPAKDDNV